MSNELMGALKIVGIGLCLALGVALMLAGAVYIVAPPQYTSMNSGDWYQIPANADSGDCWLYVVKGTQGGKDLLSGVWCEPK